MNVACPLATYMTAQYTLGFTMIASQVMNSHSLPGNLLGDYCDGELYQTSELFKEDPCALQIQLYFDEVEVCNPIGSKAKTHKLGRNMHII